MFERFTEYARRVVVLAQEEAGVLEHGWIGTEHLLLGLLREEAGLAARVLGSLDITVERVRAQVVQAVGAGEQAGSGQIPFTPPAKKVLELALREALTLGHNYIGTEHILLGLVREDEGMAARILRDFGASPEKIRTEVVRLMTGEGQPAAALPGHVRVELAATVRRALDLAAAEALRRQEPVDLGDVLVGLSETGDELAARALAAAGADPGAVRPAVEKARGGG